ncbi:YdcH family protein [Rhodobacter sp. CZR27]|uniref:YdcH family protein n=1 Tax=Rhodobacter sp. CZR27 TaxID=2033869 RepID=UPI000BBE2387|nr:YdcH family protein [Rhodobacter sp. CZR27]
MTVESHISVLRRRHDELDEQIAAALQHRGIDDLEIQAMKKEKLQLKDEITRLEAAVD